MPLLSRNDPGVRVLAWLGIAALAGIGFAGILAWHSITVEKATPNDALRRFAEIRSQLPATEPMLQVGANGNVTRRGAVLDDPDHTAPSRLRVLAYRAPEQRLVRVDLPFWFVKVKGPAVEYALHNTGLDLERLNVTPDELQRCGVCLVLDEARTNGDRLLVWTE